MHYFVEGSTAGSYTKLIQQLNNTGNQVRVGDEDTVEFEPFFGVYSHPQLNVIDPPGRNLNLAYGIVELLDFLHDDNPGLAPLFNKRLENWMVNKKFPGHYGERMNVDHFKTKTFRTQFRQPGLPTQLSRCLKELTMHPTSRRATVTIHNPILENYAEKDVACTLDLQFIVRSGYLDLICHMRSNDILWGYCYDTFHWTTLQMLMSSWLTAMGTKCTPGYYYHIAGSLHYYKRRHAQIQNVIDRSGEKWDTGDSTIIPVAHPDDVLVWLAQLREIAKLTIEDKLNIGDIPMYNDWVARSALAIAAYGAKKNHNQDLARDITAAVAGDNSQHAIWINRWLELEQHAG